MKKLLSILLALVMLLSMAIMSSAVNKGDVDGNGKVDSSDALNTIVLQNFNALQKVRIRRLEFR